MCVLADICNHTWIPECGREKTNGHMKLFIDECDMYEVSCDNEQEYELLNYSDCFTGPVSCPTVRPCPSKPTCPNHKFHRMGERYVYVTDGRRTIRTPKKDLKITLPLHMLKGKRRYTPIPKNRRKKTKLKTIQKKISKKVTTNRHVPTKKMVKQKYIRKSVKMETVILRKDTVIKNGKRLVKVINIKGFATKFVNSTYDSDFLEN